MREPREPRLTRPTPQQGAGREAAFGRPARPARQEPDLFDLFPGRNDPQGWDGDAYPPQTPAYPDPSVAQMPAGHDPYAVPPASRNAAFSPAEDYPDPFGRSPQQMAPQPQQQTQPNRPQRVPATAAYGVGPVSAVDPRDPFHPAPLSTDPAATGWHDPEWDEPAATPFSSRPALDPSADMRREPVMVPQEPRRAVPAEPPFRAQPPQDPYGEVRYDSGYEEPDDSAWGGRPIAPAARPAPEPDRYAVGDEDAFFPAGPRRGASQGVPEPPMAPQLRDPSFSEPPVGGEVPPRRPPPRREPSAPPAAEERSGPLSGLRLKNIDPRKPRMASPFPITDLPGTSQQRSKLMLWVAVAAGVLAAGGAGWFLMHSRAGADGQLGAPTIMADPSPYKVRPADPGGMQVANQDKMVYERISPDEAQQPGIEKLLPEPTVPRAPEVSEPQRPAQAVIPAGPHAMETAAAPAPSAAPAPAASAPPAPGGAVPVGQVTAPPMVASPPAPVPTTPPPSFSSPQPAVAEVPRGPAVLGPPVTGPSGTATAGVAPQAAAPVTPPPARTAATGSFSVQLAALRDEVSVRKQWDSLKTKYPDLLGPYSMGIEKADLGEKGVFYRLRATGLPTEESARVLCTELAKQKVGCLFVGK